MCINYFGLLFHFPFDQSERSTHIVVVYRSAAVKLSTAVILFVTFRLDDCFVSTLQGLLNFPVKLIN